MSSKKHILSKREMLPTRVIYIPIIIYFIILGIKSKDLLFFTVANPGMYQGLDGDKRDLLKRIPSTYIPTTIYVPYSTNISRVIQVIKEKNIQYPLITKPNDGARGRGVKKINNVNELKKYHENIGDNYLIQEFIDYPIELGVFYMHYPNNPVGKIIGVAYKQFQSVIGDGKRTFVELLKAGERTSKFIENYREANQDIWQMVIPKGKEIQVSIQGNHAQGAQCFDRSDLITENNEQLFTQISQSIGGIHYGRYDIKCTSFEDFKKGKNIKILEFNGITAEPLHLYDTKHGPFIGYKKWFSYTKSLREISEQNKTLGYSSLDSKNFLKRMKYRIKNNF